MAGKRRQRSDKALWWLLFTATAGGLVLGGLGLRALPGSPLAANAANSGWGGASGTPPATKSPTPSPSPSLPPLLVQPAKVSVETSGWYAWALLDRRTGKISGSKNLATTSTTASMIKAWIAADYLRRAADQGVTPNATRMEELRIMIRDSDNAAAVSLWSAVGGIASTKRLVSMCKLTDSKPHSNWSNTLLSARDAARMGACIADGRAAGKKWTKWLLDEMRAVRGVGDFGIRKAFEADVSKTIAIKNGWVTRDALGEWHVNCLAVGDQWTMGVITQYPANLGYEHGAEICESVARQLKTPTA